MIITVSGQVAKVVALSVPSVITKLESAPSQASTGQFPLLFVRDASVEMGERTMSFAAGGLCVIPFQICVLVEPVRQGNQFDTYKKVRTIIDELQSALENNARELHLDYYNIREDFEQVGETAYFAVIADVRTSA